MSLSALLSSQESAVETAKSSDRMHALSTSAFSRLQNFLLTDSFAFAQIVCGHNDLIPELHMPLSYLACGLTDKLILTLNAGGFDSYVTRKLRMELAKRGINWRTAEGRQQVDRLLDFVNIRWFRGSYKSSVITHAGTAFMATVNPNITAKITHATDEKAWEFCSQIGDTIHSGVYHDLFPERIPENVKENIGMKKITLGGRTVSRPQTTIQASGYLTKDIGGHYDLFIIDDLVMERNATPELLKGVAHAPARLAVAPTLLQIRVVRGELVASDAVRLPRVQQSRRLSEGAAFARRRLLARPSVLTAGALPTSPLPSGADAFGAMPKRVLLVKRVAALAVLGNGELLWIAWVAAPQVFAHRDWLQVPPIDAEFVSAQMVNVKVLRYLADVKEIRQAVRENLPEGWQRKRPIAVATHRRDPDPAAVVRNNVLLVESLLGRLATLRWAQPRRHYYSSR